jgi:phosphotransferase system  glucose/maltose/N-acetylglucosamine-specific IIC component
VAESDDGTTEQSRDGDAGANGDTTADQEPEPAVQSEALRRQQLFVGSGIAVLGGVAVTVSTLQQFPGVPFFAALVGGMLTSGVLFGFVFAGVFRGSGD